MVFWQMMPSMIAVVSAYAVALSVARQYGFFLAIDGRLLSFMTLQDVVANSLIYIPMAMLPFILSGFMHLARDGKPFERKQGGVLEFIFSSGKSPGKALVTNLIILASFVLFFDNWPAAVALNLGWLFLNVVDILESKNLWIRERFVPEYVGAVAFLIYAFANGYAGGSNLPAKGNYLLATQSDTAAVSLIAETQHFLLVRLETGQVSAVSNDEVKSLTKVTAEPAARKSIFPAGEWIAWGWNGLMQLLGGLRAPEPPANPATETSTTPA